MPLAKINDARKLSAEELAAEILAAKKKLFELRFKKATQSEVKPHEFKHLRHKIAQMFTVEAEQKKAKSVAETAAKTVTE